MRTIKRLLAICGLVANLWLGVGVTTSYALSYNISIDTSPLIGHPANPFSLEFQLTDGSGLDDANNTAVLNNFTFGTGSAVGSPTLVGGASGDLGTSVILTDSSFFNQFVQQFSPGNTLSFTLDLTANVDTGPTPDLFSFSVLDRTGAEIPTLAGFAEVFLATTFDSASPALLAFASDATRAPVGGGDPIFISQPEIAQVVTPEPSTLVSLGSVVVGLVLIRGGRALNKDRRRSHHHYI